jgi:hypothetical protein
VNGELTELAPAQSFEVVSIREPTLPGSPPEVTSDFMREADRLARAVDGSVKALDEMLVQIEAAKLTLKRSTAEPTLHTRTHAIETRAHALRERLAGWELLQYMGERPVPSIRSRVGDATSGNGESAYGPTATQRMSLEIATAEFAEAGMELTRLESDFRELQSDLEDAGVPWTPGRGASLTN